MAIMNGRRRRLPIGALVACALTAAAAPVTAGPATRPTLGPGAGSFVFADPLGDPGKPITVWTWCPADPSPTTPVLFVMHCTLRNGQAYRDDWVAHAQAKHALLIVPEFDRQGYPGTAYTDGNTVDRSGKPVDPSRWVFATVEHLFDAVKRLAGNRSPTYLLYGHSAGGQVVERFVLLMPAARYGRAIAANPGWYTLPDQDKPFPAGLGRTPTSDRVLRSILRRDVIVMLGERDTNPNDPDLNRSAPAMAEGPYRFARGQFFWRDLQGAAARLQVAPAWQLRTVPGAGHSDPQMSPAAVELLFPPAGKTEMIAGHAPTRGPPPRGDHLLGLRPSSPRRRRGRYGRPSQTETFEKPKQTCHGGTETRRKPVVRALSQGLSVTRASGPCVRCRAAKTAGDGERDTGGPPRFGPIRGFLARWESSRRCPRSGDRIAHP